jgi:hypothetical protein
MPTACYPTLPEATWVKSSRSGANGGACVEVARNLPGVVGVRDSKDPTGPALLVTPIAWLSFTSAVKDDQLD